MGEHGTVDWTKMTPREIRDALRKAPKVLTAWRVLFEETQARCTTLDDADDDRLGRCDHGDPIVFLTKGEDGWSWHCSKIATRVDAVFAKEEDAKASADDAVCAAGFVLDNEPNKMTD